jgi:transcriptional regulator with XRE-family HTH domain
MAEHPSLTVERTFAERLRSFRRERHLTQEQLAERAGLSVRTISGLEGQTLRHAPYPQTLRLLAEALELPPTEQDALCTGLGFSRPTRYRGVGSEVLPPPGRPHVVEAERLFTPTPLRPLVGRGRELARGLWLLQRSDVDVLTLVGPPGVGKTRVGLEP